MAARGTTMITSENDLPCRASEATTLPPMQRPSESPAGAVSAAAPEPVEQILLATIVITAPSSPDDSPKSFQSPFPFSLSGTSESLTATGPMSPTPFEQRLAATDPSEHGQHLFDARRALWREPGPNPRVPPQPNPSQQRLENILATPGALESDKTWEAGIDRVWDGLVGGARLRHRLPLALVIKILQAGWIREGTWPRGAVVADSDSANYQPAETTEKHTLMLSTTTTECTPSATTPGSTFSFDTPEDAVIEDEAGAVRNIGLC
ncbi:hypothetical protein BC628DRAFT_1377594 [Trametes gibbosa]|nr:hypothetical protein BC628DRAFT_1377594 [Trametes gibbosa]